MQLAKHDTLAGLAVKYNVTVRAAAAAGAAGCPNNSQRLHRTLLCRHGS